MKKLSQIIALATLVLGSSAFAKIIDLDSPAQFRNECSYRVYMADTDTTAQVVHFNKDEMSLVVPVDANQLGEVTNSKMAEETEVMMVIYAENKRVGYLNEEDVDDFLVDLIEAGDFKADLSKMDDDGDYKVDLIEGSYITEYACQKPRGKAVAAEPAEPAQADQAKEVIEKL